LTAAAVARDLAQHELLIRGKSLMSEKVVSLRGGYPLQGAQANATVIRELERLVEAARSGEIVGLAGSYVHKNNVITYSYAGTVRGYALLGGLECLKERLLRLTLARE
jgi:hypothetical protein